MLAQLAIPASNTKQFWAISTRWLAALYRRENVVAVTEYSVERIPIWPHRFLSKCTAKRSEAARLVSFSRLVTASFQRIRASFRPLEMLCHPYRAPTRLTANGAESYVFCHPRKPDKNDTIQADFGEEPTSVGYPRRSKLHNSSSVMGCAISCAPRMVSLFSRRRFWPRQHRNSSDFTVRAAGYKLIPCSRIPGISS